MGLSFPLTVPEAGKVSSGLIVFIIRLEQNGLLRPNERPGSLEIKRRLEANRADRNRRRILDGSNSAVDAVLGGVGSLWNVTTV